MPRSPCLPRRPCFGRIHACAARRERCGYDLAHLGHRAGARRAAVDGRHARRELGACGQAALGQDFTYRKPVDEDTEVRVAQDGTSLDIVFVVTQREARTEAQQTNGSSVTSDDYVGVYLFPKGTTGFQYGFFANPRGTRYQFSSENSAYTPQWTAVGHPTSSGYIVTMRIPLNVIRSGGSTAWRAQFVRSIVATGGLAVWAYAGGGTGATDPAFAGTLLGVGTKATAQRPKPRAQIYTLGELTTPRYGGSTSRIGGDFAIPVTPTASFVGTLHPDFSNVEIDQQTIAPSAFAYQFSEVRPFFTQAGQAFNYSVSCSDCPQLLYTPAIPTFREGYALEGTQGPVTFGAFNAIGNGRVDQGASVRLQHVQHAQLRRRELPARRGRHARRYPRRAQLVPGRRRQPEDALLPVRQRGVRARQPRDDTGPGELLGIRRRLRRLDGRRRRRTRSGSVRSSIPSTASCRRPISPGYELYGRKMLTFRKSFVRARHPGHGVLRAVPRQRGPDEPDRRERKSHARLQELADVPHQSRRDRRADRRRRVSAVRRERVLFGIQGQHGDSDVRAAHVRRVLPRETRRV